ncbi:hypothetical protein PQE66_gp159 [Bacillus phage PBC2]|uniref:Uncharacterized protein n=1 Tax=Bacillus phage PBC2 TaxID=1675029 RepID=A0A218KC59_9CAUD|nr:hypothetical protein PQE66_gp159 [Bacillus phage PBC2]AKQ08474.1 hypothetical protein PBC2_159 [Bacillus phage PBC2]
MIETFKKWFGKKEEKKEEPKVEVPRYDYLVIFAMEDGSYVEGLAVNWRNPSDASERIIDLFEERRWFGTRTPTGEKLVLRVADIQRATVQPEPFRPTKKD